MRRGEEEAGRDAVLTLAANAGHNSSLNERRWPRVWRVGLSRVGLLRVIVAASPVLALAACGSVPPRSAGLDAPPSAIAEQQTAVPSTLPSRGVPTDFGAAALNSRILSQVSPPSAEADLPIGPGDLIEVSVFEVEELSKLKLRIPLRGTITLPLLGQIPAAGRTAIELEDEIRDRLQQQYMHDPQVSVFVHEHKSQRISVMGAVRKGGVYTLSSRLRLADALALAEGLTDEADRVVYLIRRVPAGAVALAQGAEAEVAAGMPQPAVSPFAGGPTEDVTVAIDLEALASGRGEVNVALQAGDVIHVPRAGFYYVGGAVERPGSFFLKSKTTLDQAILAAGGVKDVAAWEDIRLYRMKLGGEREVLTFDLKDFEKGQAAPEVRKNDVIIVGKSGTKAFWYGVRDWFRGMFGVAKGL